MDGPSHEYILSVPGCWAAYGEVLAREYSDLDLMKVHRLTVDAYAAQHPGVDIPAARRSVGIHLTRLFLLLERKWPMDKVNEAMPVINGFKNQCEWLGPPDMTGTHTVLDVLNASSNEEHESRVWAWAESVWQIWAPHHDAVRSWCTDL